MESVSLFTQDNTFLSLAVFDTPDAKAVVQLVHGMEEHKERYYDFIGHLVQNGFSVVISDLRGHGASAPLLSHIADEDGDALLLRDQQEITTWIRGRFPALPILLYAHSMGTIITRALLLTDSSRYAGVVLAGYVHPYPGIGAGLALANLLKKKHGARGYSKLLYALSEGVYSKSLKEKKTDADWLSYNEENVQRYLNDPLCGKEFTIGSYCAMYALLKRMSASGDARDIRPDLPILLVSGSDDPCTGGEKGRKKSLDGLRKAGFANLTVITYPHMRHEILNEDGHMQVYTDLTRFLAEAAGTAR
ncbi:MAG: alpha/beta hydrolase [Clostridia bacterium]|nr:alpha/beta hydrolase [Clostridia bacterium]